VRFCSAGHRARAMLSVMQEREENVTALPENAPETGLDKKMSVAYGLEFVVETLGRVAADRQISISLNFYPHESSEPLEPVTGVVELQSSETTTMSALELRRLADGLGKLLPGEEQPSTAEAVDKALQMLSLHWPRG
jgi:hypothetical protein